MRHPLDPRLVLANRVAEAREHLSRLLDLKVSYQELWDAQEAVKEAVAARDGYTAHDSEHLRLERLYATRQRQMIEGLLALGFEPTSTGGGCEALTLELSPSRTLWITDGDSQIPHLDPELGWTGGVGEVSDADHQPLSPEICFDSKDPLTFLSWVKGIIATYQMEI